MNNYNWKINELQNELQKIKNKKNNLYNENNFDNIKNLIFKKNKLELELNYYLKIKNINEEIELFNEMLNNWEISKNEYNNNIEKLNEELNLIEENNKINKLKKIINYFWDIQLIIEWAEWWEESNLFAKELFDSYKKWLFNKYNYNNNDIIIKKEQKSDLWWYKNLEVVVKSKWDINPYELFFFENWVHQVMRVPKTEKKWRTHTSTVKVKILPIFDNINIEIDKNKIINEWASRAWWKGWQNVNKRETAWHIIYQLDNWEKLVIDSREERTQWKNKEIAYKRLKEKLFEIELNERLNEIKWLTKMDWSRANKIRTYQFQNNLVSDVRCSKKFSLEKILEWNFDEIHNEIIKENF
jgi:peptide chain release factor 1